MKILLYHFRFYFWFGKKLYEYRSITSSIYFSSCLTISNLFPWEFRANLFLGNSSQWFVARIFCSPMTFIGVSLISCIRYVLNMKLKIFSNRWSTSSRWCCAWCYLNPSLLSLFSLFLSHNIIVRIVQNFRQHAFSSGIIPLCWGSQKRQFYVCITKMAQWWDCSVFFSFFR